MSFYSAVVVAAVATVAFDNVELTSENKEARSMYQERQEDTNVHNLGILMVSAFPVVSYKLQGGHLFGSQSFL